MCYAEGYVRWEDTERINDKATWSKSRERKPLKCETQTSKTNNMCVMLKGTLDGKIQIESMTRPHGVRAERESL